MCMYTHIHPYIHTYIYMCMYMYVCVCVCIYTHIHTHTYECVSDKQLKPKSTTSRFISLQSILCRHALVRCETQKRC